MAWLLRRLLSTLRTAQTIIGHLSFCISRRPHQHSFIIPAPADTDIGRHRSCAFAPARSTRPRHCFHFCLHFHHLHLPLHRQAARLIKRDPLFELLHWSSDISSLTSFTSAWKAGSIPGLTLRGNPIRSCSRCLRLQMEASSDAASGSGVRFSCQWRSRILFSRR